MSSGVRFAKLTEWLFGCPHRRKTLPRTSSAAAEGGQTRQTETYMVCLQCGRRFPYDWAAMRPARRRFPWSTPAGRSSAARARTEG